MPDPALPLSTWSIPSNHAHESNKAPEVRTLLARETAFLPKERVYVSVWLETAGDERRLVLL